MTRQLSKYIGLLTLVCCLLSFSLQAKFDFNTNCRQAMQAILDLRLKDARSLMDTERSHNPDNGYVIYLEHYIASIELIITEDPTFYSNLIDGYENRFRQMNTMDDGSPYNSWLQAEMLFHTGLAQVKFGTRVSGVSKLFSAYRKIRDHQKMYPHFWQNQKLTGIYNIILDNIPPFIRWAANIFGYSGDSSLGIYQLTEYYDKAKKIPGLAEEAALILSLGYKMTLQEETGYQFLENIEKNIQSNTLVKYIYANTAIINYRNDRALDLLREIHENELQISFYGLDYLKGKCKLNHLEEDADVYLHKYLTDYPGQDYKKDVCHRLSFHYLIRGDHGNYEKFRLMTANTGQVIRDRDQEADLEIRSGIIPHTGLLKARLLCDGGYFDVALDILKGIDQKNLTNTAYRLEYHYRMGRIEQLTGHIPEAINELTKTYNDGKSQPYTFATRAALQLGKIFEKKREYAASYLWYNRCSEVFSSAHTTEGVKQMAEKGAKRVKGRQ